jgi:hypothetical protein
MNLEGPGGGRRALLLLLAVAHLFWAGSAALMAFVLLTVQTQGFDEPAPPDVLVLALLAGVAFASAYAAKLILSGRTETSMRAGRIVLGVTIAQPLLAAGLLII